MYVNMESLPQRCMCYVQRKNAVVLPWCFLPSVGFVRVCFQMSEKYMITLWWPFASFCYIVSIFVSYLKYRYSSKIIKEAVIVIDLLLIIIKTLDRSSLIIYKASKRKDYCSFWIEIHGI